MLLQLVEACTYVAIFGFALRMFMKFPLLFSSEFLLCVLKLWEETRKLLVGDLLGFKHERNRTLLTMFVKTKAISEYYIIGVMFY